MVKSPPGLHRPESVNPGAEPPWGTSEQIVRQVSAADRDGLQDVKRKPQQWPGCCEYLQFCRPPEAADAHGALVGAKAP